MAGQPMRKVRRLLQGVADRIASDEPEVAKVLLREAEEVARAAGVVLPPEAQELGQVIAQAGLERAERRRTEGEVLREQLRVTEQHKTLVMGEDVRARMMALGDLALTNLEEMMVDPAIFGEASRVPARDRLAILEVAMKRAWGAMATGAQRLSLDGVREAKVGDVGQMLNGMIEKGGEE